MVAKGEGSSLHMEGGFQPGEEGVGDKKNMRVGLGWPCDWGLRAALNWDSGSINTT